MRSFENLGFLFGPIFDDFDRNLQISFGEKDGYRIELVSPLDKQQKSPVDQYLSIMLGTPYHICYQSNDFDADLERLKNQKYKMIVAPAAAIAFNKKRVAFMMNLGFGLIEIVEN